MSDPSQPKVSVQLKIFIPILFMFLPIILTFGIAAAESPDSGFYLGGAGSMQIFTGTGSWAGYEFNIKEPLDIEGGGPVGFAWTDPLVLGLRPMIGYRLNSRFSLQLSLGLNISKSSQQTYYELDGTQYYEQGYAAEWQQKTTEALLVMHTESNFNYYIFAGVEQATIEMRMTIYEGAEIYDPWGDLVSTGETQIEQDSISALGVVLGAGIEFPSNSTNSAVFLSAQYSVTPTDGTFFGTEDFKVDVGGLTVLVGIKWFPFSQPSP